METPLSSDAWTWITAFLGEGHYLLASLCKCAQEAYRAQHEAYTFTRHITSSRSQLAWGVACGAPVTEHLHEKACAAGCLDALRYLTLLKCPAGVSSSAVAASSGNLQLMSYLRAQKTPIDSSAAEAAAEAGHFAMFRRLRWLTAGDDDGPDWLCAAVEGGNPRLVRHLLSSHYWSDAHTITHAAAKSLELVKMLREDDDCEWDARAGNAAAHAGLIDVLDYLSGSGCEIEGNIHSIAAKSGHVHVMRWAHQKGIAMDEEWFWRHLHGAQVTLGVAQYLADEGHLDSMLLHDASVAPGATCREAHEAVQWMKGAGIPVTSKVCVTAARDGNLSVLAALRSMNVTWDEQVCTSAAEHAHLHVLKWAIKNGCPYSAPDLTFAALTSCNMAVIQYLSDQQLLTPPSILGYHEMMRVTEACDTQRLSRWLLKHGYQ